MQPGNLSATRWKTTGHVTWVPPSCQHRHGWTRRRNKLDFLTKSDFTKHPHLRANDERYGSHKLSLLRCSNLPGKATGTDIRTWTRRKSKWTTGGYNALRRCGCSRSGKGTQFHCLKFLLGSAGEPTICSHCYDVLNEDIHLHFGLKLIVVLKPCLMKTPFVFHKKNTLLFTKTLWHVFQGRQHKFHFLWWLFQVLPLLGKSS